MHWAQTAQASIPEVDALAGTNVGGETTRNRRHCDTRPSRIQGNMNVTKKVIIAVESFRSPFEMKEDGRHPMWCYFTS